MSRVVFQPKLVSSTQNYKFDFSSQLAIGETISTATTTASVYSGTDALPNAIISGAASISGNIVTQAVTAGTVGVTYELKCQITTSGGQTLLLVAFLTIIPDLT